MSVDAALLLQYYLKYFELSTLEMKKEKKEKLKLQSPQFILWVFSNLLYSFFFFFFLALP